MSNLATIEATPITHLTRHNDGQWSVIHQGMPVTRPQSLQACHEYLHRFTNIISINVWDAATGAFLTKPVAVV